MKTMIRILGVAAVVAMIAAAVPTAQANCIPGTTFSTYGAGGFFYVNLPAGANNANVVGKFWAKGNNGSANNGPYDDALWLKFDAAYGKWYVSGDTSSGMIGCPNGSNLIMTIELADGSSITAESIETPASAVRWDFSTLATDLTPAPKPRPKVASSSRAGTTVNVQLNSDPQVGGNYGPQGGAVTIAPTYRLAIGSGATDPGSDAALYAAGPAVTPGTPFSFPANCTVPTADQWIAIQTIVDGVPAATVGPRTRINCNPALADPKFKHVDRPARPNPRSER
jgi:hypothetical protein